MPTTAVSKRLLPLWVFALVGLGLSAVFIYALNQRHAPPKELTLQDLTARGEALGWVAHKGFHEGEAEGVLFIDTSVNPQATPLMGAQQVGALYILEFPTTKQAQQASNRPGTTQFVWGKFYLVGDPAMTEKIVHP